MRKTGSRFAWALAAGGSLAFAVAAHAQEDYPNRPIRFITPYAPGGSTTVIARLVGHNLTERWGQNVIVDNRPGGNTVIGTATLANAPADGYNIMIVASTHAILSSLIKTPYDPIKSFEPVSRLGISPQVLVLNNAVPANSVQELIALAKSKPGQLNFASSGAGGPTHLAAELFNITAGIKTQHIPYKGAGPAMIDLLGGHVQMFFSVPINIVGHVKAGRLKGLAVTGDARIAPLPNMPTFAEAGLPGYDMHTWTGILAPAGTPKPIVDKLSAEVRAILARAEVKQRLNGLGMTTMGSTPEQFTELIKSEIVKFQKVIKAANIKID
jgi:tripartite-type tricarboxylate transporter receptor subunit TctC